MQTGTFELWAEQQFSKLWSRTSTSTAPGSLLERQVLSLHPQGSGVCTESEILGAGPAICVLTNFSGDSDVCPSLRTTALDNNSLITCFNID